MLEALKEIDGIIGILMDGLIQRGLLHCVNLIVMSDHGALAAIDTTDPKPDEGKIQILLKCNLFRTELVCNIVVCHRYGGSVM